jgi:hypothetical protein
MTTHIYTEPTDVYSKPDDFTFTGYFTRTNGSSGKIVSSANSIEAAMNRTIFDSIFCSPYKPEDITILRIDSNDEVLYAIDEEWRLKDVTSIFG